MLPQKSTLFAALFAVSVTIASSNYGENWPRWLGHHGDSTWREKGVVTKIPENGLNVAWRSPIALGYSGPSVVDGKVFVMDYVRRSGEIAYRASWKDDLEGVERIRCYALAEGELIWEHAYPREYSISYGGGPRCTPTIADGKVYALGAEGDLHCLDAETGKVIWKRSFKNEYGVETPLWGHSAHPLVDRDTLYCVIGGEGSVAVAFDKDSGEEKWRALSAPEPGYCPPTIIEHGGARQLIIWHPESVNSLNPSTGKIYWTIPLSAAFRLSVIAPRKRDDRLFISSQKDTGFMLKLDMQKPTAEILWQIQPGLAASTVAATSLFTEDAAYACDVESSSLIAFDPNTGERFWQTKDPVIGKDRKGRHGAAFIVRNTHFNRYFILSETGDLIIAYLSPEGFDEIGRTRVIEPTNRMGNRPVIWSHPAFANQSMILRNDEEIIRIDLAQSSYR